jgi:hypothetical protein
VLVLDVARLLRLVLTYMFTLTLIFFAGGGHYFLWLSRVVCNCLLAFLHAMTRHADTGRCQPVTLAVVARTVGRLHSTGPDHIRIGCA